MARTRCNDVIMNIYLVGQISCGRQRTTLGLTLREKEEDGGISNLLIWSLFSLKMKRNLNVDFSSS